MCQPSPAAAEGGSVENSESLPQPPEQVQPPEKVKSLPAQEEAQKTIAMLNSDLTNIQLKLDSNLSPNPGLLLQLKKRKTLELQRAEHHLKSLKSNVARQAKFREERKRKIKELQDLHPEGPKIFKSRPGQPRIEENQPG